MTDQPKFSEKTLEDFVSGDRFNAKKGPIYLATAVPRVSVPSKEDFKNYKGSIDTFGYLAFSTMDREGERKVFPNGSMYSVVEPSLEKLSLPVGDAKFLVPISGDRQPTIVVLGADNVNKRATVVQYNAKDLLFQDKIDPRQVVLTSEGNKKLDVRGINVFKDQLFVNGGYWIGKLLQDDNGFTFSTQVDDKNLTFNPDREMSATAIFEKDGATYFVVGYGGNNDSESPALILRRLEDDSERHFFVGPKNVRKLQLYKTPNHLKLIARGDVGAFVYNTEDLIELLSKHNITEVPDIADGLKSDDPKIKIPSLFWPSAFPTRAYEEQAKGFEDLDTQELNYEEVSPIIKEAAAIEVRSKAREAVKKVAKILGGEEKVKREEALGLSASEQLNADLIKKQEEKATLPLDSLVSQEDTGLQVFDEVGDEPIGHGTTVPYTEQPRDTEKIYKSTPIKIENGGSEELARSQTEQKELRKKEAVAIRPQFGGKPKPPEGVQKELVLTKQELIARNQKVTALEGKLNKAYQDLKKSSEQANVYESNLSELKGDIEGLESELVQIKSRALSFENRYIEADKAHRELSQEVQGYRSAKDNALKEKEEILKKKTKIQEELDSMVKRYAGVDDQVKSLEEQVRLNETVRQSLMGQVDTLTSQVTSMTSSIVGYESKIKSINEDRESLARSLDEKKGNGHEALLKKKDELEQKIRYYETQVNALTAQVTGLTAGQEGLITVNRQLKEAEKEVTELKREVASYEVRIGDLQKELAAVKEAKPVDETDGLFDGFGEDKSVENQVDDFFDGVKKEDSVDELVNLKTELSGRDQIIDELQKTVNEKDDLIMDKDESLAAWETSYNNLQSQKTPKRRTGLIAAGTLALGLLAGGVSGYLLRTPEEVVIDGTLKERIEVLTNERNEVRQMVEGLNQDIKDTGQSTALLEEENKKYLEALESQSEEFDQELAGRDNKIETLTTENEELENVVKTYEDAIRGFNEARDHPLIRIVERQFGEETKHPLIKVVEKQFKKK